MDERLTQARQIWASTDPIIKGGYGKSADITTAIGTYWLSLAQRGLKPGPPMTIEYPAVDWSGKPIICQEFSGGHAESLPDGKVFFYDPYGNQM